MEGPEVAYRSCSKPALYKGIKSLGQTKASSPTNALFHCEQTRAQR